MEPLNDAELLRELESRMDFNRRALHDLHALTRQLEEMNRKLRDSESIKSNFLSNIRNEIINPLASILGLSLQLVQQPAPPETVARTARLIHDEAFNLDFQLSNIFAAAELEAGDALPGMASVKARELFSRTISSFLPFAERKRVRVLFSAEHAAGEFLTDPAKLQLILANLLANAIEFSHEGGEVQVELLLDGELTLSVKDYGIGIETDRQEQIFDRFRQMETGSAKCHPGHGLGLSIVRSMVEMLGGTLLLESVPGQGTMFSVTLPDGHSAGYLPSSDEGNELLFLAD